jgi:hypothetical protein
MDTHEWTTFGKYQVRIRPDKFRIFPKGADGKTRPVWIRRVFVELQRTLDSGVVVSLTFKHYLHQRHTYWSDSRDTKGSRPRHHVRQELARLLFDKDQDQAKRLMLEAEALL